MEPGRCPQCPYFIKGINCVNEHGHEKDILDFIHSLQNENATLKTELRKECEEHEEFTKKAKAEIERLTEGLDYFQKSSDYHEGNQKELEVKNAELQKQVDEFVKIARVSDTKKLFDGIKEQAVKDTAKEIFEKIFGVLFCFTTHGKSEEYNEGFIQCLSEIDERIQKLAKEHGVEVE